MAVTTKDLARICGVSRATINRALNNLEGINEETKKRILATEKELGYEPDLVGHRIDGLIISPVSSDRAFLKYLNQLSIPAVVIGNQLEEDTPYVDIDEQQLMGFLKAARRKKLEFNLIWQEVPRLF